MNRVLGKKFVILPIVAVAARSNRARLLSVYFSSSLTVFGKNAVLVNHQKKYASFSVSRV